MYKSLVFGDWFFSIITFTFYIYAFSRRFYPKRLTIAFRLYNCNQYMCSLGIEPTTFCAADAMLYHWATQELSLTQSSVSHDPPEIILRFGRYAKLIKKHFVLLSMFKTVVLLIIFVKTMMHPDSLINRMFKITAFFKTEIVCNIIHFFITFDQFNVF